MKLIQSRQSFKVVEKVDKLDDFDVWREILSLLENVLKLSEGRLAVQQ